MKKLTILFILCGLSWGAYSAEVKVEWVEPDQYTDIKSPFLDGDGQYSAVRFERIERHIQRLAEMHLAEDARLTIHVHDLNLAGRIQAQVGESNQDFTRRALPNEFPKMVLSYQLIDAQGQVTREGEHVSLEGRAIRSEGRSQFPHVSRRDRELIGQEIRMLNQWFKATFIDAA